MISLTDLALQRARRANVAFQPVEGVRRLARDPRYLAWRRALLGVAGVTVGFHYSLETLLRSLKAETPLAYLGLVPFIALFLAAARVRPGPNEPDIHDRQIDYIIGVPLIVGAIVFDVLMPVRMSTLFWLYRLDLVAFPLFVAGTIALLFGTRALWRLKLPVLFLLFAWPLPYTTLLTDWLTAFTASTLGGLNVALRFVHVAHQVPGQDVGTYLVSFARGDFPVSVASACSGVNGVVGYLLVALAFLTIVVGRWWCKALWLAFGLGGVWLSNVARILVILVAGHRWGEGVAIDVLHPFMGLVTFNLIVVAMVVVMRRFGLRLRFRGAAPQRADLSEHVRRAVPRVRLATGVLVVLTLAAALANSSLRSYDLVLSSLGAPRLSAFSEVPSHPADWTVAKIDAYTWARPYFGNDSTWYRYAFNWGGDPSDALRSNQTVISDVINTSDVTSFSTFGIEACYRFHGYQLHSIRTVDMGGGITGNVLAYFNPKTRSDWTTAYWHWPVRTAQGRTRYERVTLMLINTEGADVKAPPPGPAVLRQLGLGVQNALAGGSPKVDARLDRTRTFLTEFARSIIARQQVATSAPGSFAAPR